MSNFIDEKMLTTTRDDIQTVSVTIAGKTIEFTLMPDGEPLEKSIAKCNEIIQHFAEYESHARQKIVTEFLDSYNHNWRLDDDDDETLPELTAEQFSDNLTLVGITVIAGSWMAFDYDDNDMFAGHLLTAQASDGKTFDYATMSG